LIAYLDASVVLRLVLGERGRLEEWDRVEEAVASALTEVECLRTLDRLSRQGALQPEELADCRAAVLHLLEAVEVVDVVRPVLWRAAKPFSTPLGTLDAIHLAAALLWRVRLTLATHGRELATAARSFGFEVIGV
jgi:uncharacterized protein